MHEPSRRRLNPPLTKFFSPFPPFFMSAKAAQLSPALVVRKGQAVPTAGQDPAAPGLPPVHAPALTALTLKLDDERYRRLKSLGLRRPRRSSQDILVAALDAYLAAQGA